jgi:hypothetical protein
MNLQEWGAMDRAARRQIEVEHYRRGTPWKIGVLAKEAGNMLAQELKDMPQVTAAGSGEDNIVRQAILMVTTSLGEGEKLSGVPEEFAGFPVVQFGVADRKRDYLQHLEFVLRAATLPLAEVNAELKHFDNELSDIGSVYYAHTPVWWFAERLTPAFTKGRLVGKPMLKLRDDLRGKLGAFFEEADPNIFAKMEPADVSRLRAIFQTVLARHGLSL